MKFAISLAAISIGCSAARVPAPVDPFVGDWKLDPARSAAIDVMKVQGVNGNTYTFDFGGADETIAVDGTDQPGYAGTTLAVTAEAPGHWKVVRKADGHVWITAAWSLAADGNTLADDFTELAPDGQVASHVSYLYHRTAAGSGFVGTWERPVPTGSLPSSTLEVRPYEASGLSFTAPAQQMVRNVKFDGKDYPLVLRGVVGDTTSSAHRVDERTLDVTEKTKGKVTKTQRIELSPDHNTLTLTAHPVGQQGANSYVFERQSSGTRS